METPLIELLNDNLTDLENAGQSVRSLTISAGLDRMKRVREDFERRISALEEELKGCLRDARQDRNMDLAWDGLAGEQAKCSRLVRECLALVEGSLMRAQGFDGGLCPIADALLDEFNEASQLGWKSFTLPADGESFADLAEIIRLRFPVTGIWDLPIAAHEFGHFAAGKMQPRSGESTFSSLEDYRKELQDAGIERYLDEFFADAAGTFALGPAFVRSCLFRRFQPMHAEVQKDECHPSFGRRAYFILEILRRMGSSVKEYRVVCDTAGDRWRRAVEAAGKKVVDSDENLKKLAGDLYAFLKDCARNLEYTRWDRANSLSVQLVWKSDVSLADVLNAAWITRLTPDALSPDEISKKSVSVCNEVIRQRDRMR